MKDRAAGTEAACGNEGNALRRAAAYSAASTRVLSAEYNSALRQPAHCSAVLPAHYCATYRPDAALRKKYRPQEKNVFSFDFIKYIPYF